MPALPDLSPEALALIAAVVFSPPRGRPGILRPRPPYLPHPRPGCRPCRAYGQARRIDPDPHEAAPMPNPDADSPTPPASSADRSRMAAADLGAIVLDITARYDAAMASGEWPTVPAWSNAQP